MKKFYFNLALVLILSLSFIASAGVCNAQTKESDESGDAIIGTIDIAAVYALHPMMQFYDQKLGLFIKAPKQGTAYDDFLKITQTRRDEFKKLFEGQASEIKRLKEEVDVLKKEVKKLDVQKVIEAAPINEDFDARIQKAVDEDAKKKLLAQRTAELVKVDKKFNTEIEAKNKKINDLLDSYQKIQRSLLKIYYLTPEETAKKFEEITTEIKDTIKLAANKKGLKAVVNLNTVSGRDDKKKQPETTIAEKEKVSSDLSDILANGPDYTKAMSALRTFESGLSKDLLKTKNPEFNETEYVKMLQQMSKDREKEAVSAAYLSKDYIMNLDQLVSATTAPIVYGNTDLTWLTVIAIMVKNGIPKEKAETISEVILNSLKK